MRFIKGPIPENDFFLPAEDGWKPIREPDPKWMPLLACAFGSPIALGLYFFSGMRSVPVTLLESDIILLCLLLLVPVHESLHALFMPWSGSGAIVIGYWKEKGLLFTHYEGEMKKGRFITAMSAPLVCISILPAAVLTLAGIDTPIVIAAPVFHAFLCGGDLFGVFGTVLQIPNGALVRNKGWKTYWKMKAA